MICPLPTSISAVRPRAAATRRCTTPKAFFVFGNNAAIESALARIESELQLVKADVGELKADVHVLKSDVGGLKADVHVLKSDVGGLKADLGGLKDDILDVRRDFDVLRGTTLAATAVNFAPGVAILGLVFKVLTDGPAS